MKKERLDYLERLAKEHLGVWNLQNISAEVLLELIAYIRELEEYKFKYEDLCK